MANWQISGPYSHGAYRVSTDDPIEHGSVLIEASPKAKEMAEIICRALLHELGEE